MGDFLKDEQQYKDKKVWMWGGDANTFKRKTLSCGDSISDKVKDFTIYSTQDELIAVYQKAMGNFGRRVPQAYWHFMKDVKVGDIVIIYTSEIVNGVNHHKLHGWGVFTSDIIYNSESKSPLQREVEWKETFDAPIEEYIVRNSLYFFGTKDEQANKLKVLIGLPNDDIDITKLIKEFYSDNGIENIYENRVAINGSNPNIWLWAPGENASEWENLQQSDEMALGWNYTGDARQYATDEELAAALKEDDYYKDKSVDQALYMVKAFRDDIIEGDLVLVKGGLSQILGWGYVTSDYYFDDAATTMKSRRRTKWMSNEVFTVGKRKSNGKDRLLPRKALTEISKYPNMVSEIFELINKKDNMEYGNPSQEVIEAAKLLDNAGQVILQGAPGCGKTYITTELAVYLCDGKVARSHADNKKRYKELQEEGRIGFTTFHQSLDYEEFVEGLKPDTQSDDDEMKFIVQPGIFKRMCTNASNKITSNFSECYENFVDDIADKGDFEMTSVNGAQFHVRVNSNRNLTLLTSQEKNQNGTLTKENIEKTYLGELKYWYGYMMGVVNHLRTSYGLVEPMVNVGGPKKYVLIIDEINRANISKVLGELITLLEKSKRIGNDDEFTVTLPYSGETFGVPDNLYIIGTMNTADRSLGYIDYAIRRRFAFMTLKSEHYHIREFYNDHGELFNKETKLFTDVKNLIKGNLATDFELDDFMLGHSYFMAKTDEDYELNLKYKIIPLLQEYLRDGILVNKEDINERITQLGK